MFRTTEEAQPRPVAIHPEPLLRVRALSVEFPTKGAVVRAVAGISFDLEEGERLAIVGESGSGKSVMAMSLMQLLPYPGRVTRGSARLDGQDILALKGRGLRALRGSSMTMVFQDPMSALNPVLRVSEQILPPLRRHLGLGQGEARERAMDVLQRTGIPDAPRILQTYPHELSGGMRQRVLLAMALACGPRVLIADEPTTALDVTVQAQIVALLKQISDDQNTAIIFITHDMGLVARFAHRVAVMYAGRIVETGPIRQVFSSPRHPYTRALLASIPAVSGARRQRLFQVDGSPPDLSKPIDGCAFAPRCDLRTARCLEQRPVLEAWDPDHAAACIENSPLEHALSDALSVKALARAV
ncbi:MAG TPA: ABC transporter ATP-binding protein [Dehalococcoidia bacterium]|nr:ABC transporter ATP-binding protein [Dehalococcoidia bacterium]